MDNSTNSKMPELFKEGIFFAPSRTYGEQYIEPIIREVLDLNKSKTNENDAIDKMGKYFEIKSSKVLKLTKKEKKLSLIAKILLENDKNVVNRLINFEDCYTASYLSNIQNIKRDHFSNLVYVMLFKDCIKIFISKKEEICNIPNWCGKHGKYDALDKNGQFGITKNNVKWHIENNLYETLTWDKVYKIAEKIK
jgi:hypothetical protein